MTRLVPTMAEFDRVLAAPSDEFLSVETLARKLAEHADPERIYSDDHCADVLLAAGVMAWQVDHRRWADVKARAARIIKDRQHLASNEVVHAIGLTCAFAFLFAAIASPAFAADGPLDPWIGLKILLSVLGLATGWGLASVWKSRRVTRDPHTDPHGDVTRGFEPRER